MIVKILIWENMFAFRVAHGLGWEPRTRFKLESDPKFQEQELMRNVYFGFANRFPKIVILLTHVSNKGP